MSNGTDSGPSLEEIGTLSGFITDNLVRSLNKEQVKYWIGKKTELRKKLFELFEIKDDGYADIRSDWQKFYKTHFSWDVDFSRVLIPVCPGEGWRLIFIAKGVTIDKAYERAKALFKCWKYTDGSLDSAIPTNIRTASEHYAVWVRTGFEPDAEFMGKSTNQADPTMKLGVTVLERIILEIKYFSETGSHLDIKGVTFCSGSRSSDGGVPYADWSGVDGFGVHWCDLDDSCSDYGVRQAVALNS